MHASPSPLLLIAIGLLSASALGYEILLMKLLGIIQWHHFATMVISLALLGYGASGSFLCRFRDTLLPAFGTVFTTNATLFGLSSVTCFAFTAGVAMNPLELLWSAREWIHLAAIAAFLLVPFFFAANAIGISLQRYQDHIGRIYAADLLGAGSGAIGTVALLFVWFPERALHLVGFVGITAALLGYLALSPLPRWVATLMAASLIGITTLAYLAEPQVNPGEYKALSQMRHVYGSRVIKERSSPLGVLTVVGNSEIPLRHVPGLSLSSSATVPEQLAVFTDGDAMTVVSRWDGNVASLAYLDDVPSAAPYHLLAPNPDVLILGAGGGTEVLQALQHRARHVDAVELNPQLIGLIRQSLGTFSGHVYDDPRLSVHLADARAFVSAADSRYALIQLALVDGFNVAGAGLHSAQEDYLYTQEALAAYLEHLAPEGMLAITRWVHLPPRDNIKLFATAVATLSERGVREPGRQLAWIRNWQVATLLIKNGRFTQPEFDRIRRFCATRAFDVAYLPDPKQPATNIYNELSHPYFSAAAEALLSPDGDGFIRDYKFNIQPATDDRPYFHHFFRWPLLAEAWALRGAGGLSLLDTGYPLLIATLLLVLVLSVLLILAPLRTLARTHPPHPDGPGPLRTSVYFGCIGLAFMFIEIVSMQRFTLYLAHPLYAIPVVLAAFLIFAGMGSQIAARIPRRSARGRAVLAALGAIILLGLQVAITPPLFQHTLQFSNLTKVALVLALIAPLAACMGMMVPLGMTRLTYGNSALLPWAYGVNGCLSVLGVILSSVFAMHLGQTNVLLLAMALYGFAARFVP